MLKNLAASIGFAVAATFSLSASALVVTGETALHTSPLNAGGYYEVNYYNFTTGGGNIIFDVWASGLSPIFLNHQLAIYRDDGSLDQADLLTTNDNAPNSSVGRTDGSTSNIDPYLSVAFGAGNYILAIGISNDLANSSSLDGRQDFGAPGPYSVLLTFAYQITATGDISNFAAVSQVPEPGSLALIGLGLAGLAGARRRKQA